MTGHYGKKWIGSLVGLKIKQDDNEKVVTGRKSRSRKYWKPWRSGSRHHKYRSGDGSETCSVVAADDGGFSAAVATVVRAPLRDFKQWRSTPTSTGKPSNNSSLISVKHRSFDHGDRGWSWLERWMAAKPWENRLMEQANNTLVHTCSKISEEQVHEGKYSKLPDPGAACVKIKKSNVTTRISAKPPNVLPNHGSTTPSVAASCAVSSVTMTAPPRPLPSARLLLQYPVPLYRKGPERAATAVDPVT